MKMKLLVNFPLPVILAVAVPQMKPPETPIGAPEWFSIALGTTFVVLWFLNAIGKLPGASGERRLWGFTDDDRTSLDEARTNSKKIVELLAWRDDDGMERVLVMAKLTKDSHELLRQAAADLRANAELMKTVSEHLTRGAA